MINEILMNKKIVNGSIILMGLSVLFFILYQFKSFVMPFVMALLITFLVVPLTRFKGKNRIIVWIGSIIFIIFVVFGSVLLISHFFKTQVNSQTNLNDEVPENTNILDVVESSDENGLTKIDIYNLIDDEKLGSMIENLIQYLLKSTQEFATIIVLTGIFLLFVLPSYDSIVNTHADSLKGVQRRNFLDLIEKIESSVRNYLGVKTLTSLITAIISGFIMFLFGIENYLLFAILTFFLNFIPNIGSIMAVMLVVIYELVFIGYSTALLYMGIFLSLIQFTIGNILEPKLFGNVMSISPIIILLSLFFWGVIWGIPGMFFAVPLTVIIKIILDNYLNIKNNNL